MNIEYAIMIDTRKPDETIEAIGMFHSSIALVTGRPDYNARATGPGADYISDVVLLGDEVSFTVSGLTPSLLPLDFDVAGYTPVNPPVNPVTGLPQRRWKEGLISREYLGNPKEIMDPTLGGGYSTMAAAGLSLMNNPPNIGGKTLFQYLLDNSIDFFRCDIKICPVVDGVFTQWQEIQIEKLIDKEHLAYIESLDAFLKIHKDVLKIEVTEEGYPEAPEDSRSNFIPLVIGRLPDAKLMPLTGQVIFQNIGKFGDTEFEAAPIISSNRDGTIVRLANSMEFVTADPRLVGKYMKVIRVGMEEVDVKPRRIVAATVSGNLITITLESSFENGVAPNYSPPSQLGWWVYVYSLSGFGAVSDGSVYSLTAPLLGFSNGEFVNIEGRRIASYPDADGPYPFAGITALPEGEFANLIPDFGMLVGVGTPTKGTPNPSNFADVPDVVLPTVGGSRDVYENTPVAFGISSPLEVKSGVTNPYPANGQELPVISSRVQTTDEYYQRIARFTEPTSWTAGSFTPSVFDSVEIDLALPESLLLESDESLAFAMDADFVCNFVGFNSDIRMRAWVSAYLIGNDNKLSSTPATTVILGGTEDEDLIVFDGNGGAQSETLRMCGEYYFTGEGNDSTAVEFIQDTLDVSSMLRNKDTRATVKGIRIRIIYEFAQEIPGLFGGSRTWECGHKLYQIALYRKRDTYEGEKFTKVTGVTFGGTWGGRKTASDPVLSIPDAIEYLIRERDGSTAINTASFDLCLARRPVEYWHIGKQITEQAVTPKGNPGTTRNLIEDLCKTAFLSIVPGRDKNRRLINLEGYGDDAQVITDIIHDTMGEGRVVGLDRVFTGCEYRYDKNPATGDYRSSVFIRKTSEEAFPDPDELVPGTTTPLWTTYAGGFGGDYPTALTVWERYHLAFVMTQRENFDKLDLDWCQSNARLGLDSTIPDVPVFLALIRSEWYSVPRKQYTFRVPVTQANLNRLLGDRVIFRDIKRTGNLYYFAIVEEQVLITALNQIEIKVSHKLNDQGFEESPEANFITETIGGDTITAIIGGSNTITAVIN